MTTPKNKRLAKAHQIILTENKCSCGEQFKGTPPLYTEVLEKYHAHLIRIGMRHMEAGPMSQRNPTPSVGRIVHYTPEKGGDIQAAIITAVHTSVTPNDDDYLGEVQLAEQFRNVYDEMEDKEEVPEYIVGVSLMVLHTSGMTFEEHAGYSPEYKPGYWAWPRKV